MKTNKVSEYFGIDSVNQYYCLINYAFVGQTTKE